MPQPLTPGTVTMMMLRHDAWCRTLKTQRTSDCTCDPEIEFQVIDAKKEENDAGDE